MVEMITSINDKVNGFVWGIPMLVLLVGTGILMTLLTKVFQIAHIGYWMKHTLGSIFTDRHITKRREPWSNRAGRIVLSHMHMGYRK